MVVGIMVGSGIFRTPGPAQLARDLPGRPKNSRAHHDADDHGEAVEKTKRPF